MILIMLIYELMICFIIIICIITYTLLPLYFFLQTSNVKCKDFVSMALNMLFVFAWIAINGL